MTDSDDFAAAFEDAFARLRGRVEAVCADTDRCEWPVRVAVGVRTAFAFAIADPGAARLLTRQMLTGGAADRARHEQLVSYFAGLLCCARKTGSHQRPDLADSAAAGGVVLLVGQRLAGGREDELPAIARDAAQFVLMPWIGPERAWQTASEHC